MGERIRQTSRHLINGAIVAAAVFVGVVGFLLQAGPVTTTKTTTDDMTVALGRMLLGPYAVPFELLGVLLVAALLGALYFARED